MTFETWYIQPATRGGRSSGPGIRPSSRGWRNGSDATEMTRNGDGAASGAAPAGKPQPMQPAMIMSCAGGVGLFGGGLAGVGLASAI